ncbi:alpha-amylase family glycosyl hydrolase [Prosthecobacter sp.]|uniref:alpha-amylase family glycosyl hydrolase n=1 Tax=Prosthecobacter sp. TaxID=1965333 RepID=UPI002ABAE67F|nr:alpha-amylase family glycosyl hydrolase [Prosthecobacter sp.]MDZ4402137.1 alpha-amylase family glycosyl hydrolase [Prosthecobacter sp.]
MKRILPVLLFATSAFAWNANEVDFPGDGQGWDLGTTDSTKFTGPDGSTEWFRFQWTAGTAISDYNFKMVTGNNWDQDYGGNLIFPKNELAILYYQPVGDSAAKLSGGVTNGKRYVFTVKDPGLANTFISVMELSAAPVAITGVSRNATSGLITINLSGTPAVEEKVYVRYTDSGWTYSQVIQATVAGNTATATIPDIKDGKNYAWYVLTSTATPDKFHSGFATDALSLAWNNNAGANYTISGVNRMTDFSVNNTSGPYQTTKFFIDEIAGETFPLNVSATFNAGTPPTEVEVVTNLNRRDKAEQDNNSDGVPDGILSPPRDLCGQNETHYYKAHAMTNSSGSTWNAAIPVTKTGAYRATVRYRFAPTGPWFYYGDRDHAVVVSPKKTLEMTLYEVNPLTIEATAASEAGRSTFLDMLGAADGDSDGIDPVNLDYFNTIQANCLWFQPIHPTGGLGVENDPATSSPYSPGSPYATKNFFAVSPYLGTAGTEASAMSEFQSFVTKADDYGGSVGTINVMLDFVANHTAWDAVYGQGGVDLGFTGSTTNAIPVNWYSRTGDYGQPATYFTSLSDKDKAVAPDRNDFGKWSDVTELYYGRYSAQWRFDTYTAGSEPHKNEDDVMDWNSLSPEVIKLWRYLGHYPIYWLQQTGHSLANSTTGSYAARLAADNKGIDSLRCDFGQGLPNPLWEYIINRTRSAKWNFVFMAETLDGEQPGYRSNRVFDILNESLVFNFTASHVNEEGVIQSALESRRSNYRTGAILLNITGHDEVLPDNDAWLNATRYAALAAVPGLPMTFYGQEQGIQNYNTNGGTFHYDGFETDHELNFGKRIPHFKKWNRAQFWTLPPPNNTGMAQWYGRVNWARLNSPAIKSINQYYLDKRPNGTTPNNNVFAIAKYEQAGASPAFKDVVICFANLFVHGAAHGVASDTFDLCGGVGDPLWSLLGLQNSAARQYNIRNLASSNAGANIWASPRSGADIYSNGVFVSLDGGTSNAITNDGELAQYLKVVDVTPPPASAPNATYYQIGTQGAFTWTSNASAHDNITEWRISIGNTPGGSNVVNNASVTGSTTSYTFTGTTGTTYYATLSAVSSAEVSSAPSSSDSGNPNPSSQTTPVLLLSPTGDHDGDGMSNENESTAGTSPLDRTSTFAITSATQSENTVILAFPTVLGRFYHVYSSPDLVSWTLENETEAKNRPGTGGSLTFTDQNPSGTQKFYQARVTANSLP